MRDLHHQTNLMRKWSLHNNSVNGQPSPQEFGSQQKGDSILYHRLRKPGGGHRRASEEKITWEWAELQGCHEDLCDKFCTIKNVTEINSNMLTIPYHSAKTISNQNFKNHTNMKGTQLSISLHPKPHQKNRL